MHQLKQFLSREMSWKRLLILAAVSAGITAALNCIPFLEDTSFTNPAETMEIWLVLAVYIVLHCSGYRDAMLKTFVFFLISQPLIYLLEVPFKEAGWSLFRYYPYWGFLTVLTIPAAAVCYRMKKDDLPAVLILSAGNFLLALIGSDLLSFVIYNFPQKLLAFLFCMGMPFVLCFTVFKRKKSGRLAAILAGIILILLLGRAVLFPESSSSTYPLDEGTWTVETVSKQGIEVTVLGDELQIDSHTPGTYEVTLISETGEEADYEVTVDGATMLITVRKKEKH